MKGSGPFAVTYPSVAQAFNPSRYYAETGQAAADIPNVAQGTVPAGSSIRGLLPILIIVLALWLYERHRIGLGLRFGGSVAG